MPTPYPAHTFAGFSSPNFTQVPDELFDVLMPQLTDAELRVLLYIVRRTFGFKRQSDNISLSQMVSGITTKDGDVLDTGTGMSKSTVARGLKGLRDKKVVIAVRNRSEKKGDEPTTYQLRMKHETLDPSKSVPVSQLRDTPPVSSARQGVSHQRDTQYTVRQHTDFEYSKGEDRAEEPESANHVQLPHSRSKVDRSGSATGMEAIGATIARRRPDASIGDDRTAITATIKQFAEELGDKAPTKSSVARAMRLFEESGLHRDLFIDSLHLAKGEVKDRRKNPGKAPLPRNQMAYFFAVVEDRLGRRDDRTQTGN